MAEYENTWPSTLGRVREYLAESPWLNTRLLGRVPLAEYNNTWPSPLGRIHNTWPSPLGRCGQKARLPIGLIWSVVRPMSRHMPGVARQLAWCALMPRAASTWCDQIVSSFLQVDWIFSSFNSDKIWCLQYKFYYIKNFKFQSIPT